MYKYFFKRLIDIVLSASILVLTLPITLFVSVGLLMQNKGTPFFFQDRPGYLEKRIRIVKFKSMTDKKDSQGNLLADTLRITKFGAFIRKTSLDELPQLINVLKGEMSLVRPRPLLFKYIPLYSENQKRRHNVKPGITGWAQVNGRNSISWTKKFDLDVYYVHRISFLLDLKILWLTLIKVLKREGVNQNESRPMEPFNGRN